VDYRVFDKEGEIIAEGRFPDREMHWPRLRYHRYFMLSGNLTQIWVPPEDPGPDVPQRERDALARKRTDYVTLKSAIEEGITRLYGGDHAVVTRMEHRAPTPKEFWDGWKLTDERLFTPLPESAPKEEELRR
jgi:hypothetical protein